MHHFGFGALVLPGLLSRCELSPTTLALPFPGGGGSPLHVPFPVWAPGTSSVQELLALEEGHVTSPIEKLQNIYKHRGAVWRMGTWRCFDVRTGFA